MSSVSLRAEVPPLLDEGFPLGGAGELTTSFPAGPDALVRGEQDRELQLAVTLRGATSPRAVLVLCRLDEATERDPCTWHEYAFAPEAEGRLRLALRLKVPGNYLGRVKYSLDGQTWCWSRTDYTRLLIDPARCRALRIYTLIPRVSGHFGAWLPHLEQARRLGFTAVHLLPLTPMDYSLSPYAAREHFTVDPVYADPYSPLEPLAQFERVVEYARQLGLGLCLDLVLNHVGVNSVIARSRPEWLVPDPDEPDGRRRAGWTDGKNWYKWHDLARLNYEHPHPPTRRALWEHMTAYARFWAAYAARTGGLIRLDNLHSSHPPFITELLARLRREFPELMVLAELFDEQQKVERRVIEYGLNLLLATPWEHHFVPPLRSYLERLHRAADRARFLSPMTSHDSGAVPEEFGDLRSTMPRYAVAALLGGGQTGMVQGTETGVPHKLGFIGPPQSPLPHGGHDFGSFIARVNQVLAEHECFQRAGNLRLVDEGHDAVLAAVRLGADGQPRFLVAVNLDTCHVQHLVVDGARHGLSLRDQHVTDVLGDFRTTPGENRLELWLQPCQALALRLGDA